MSLISKDDVIEQMRYEAETDENQEHKFVYERAAHIIAAMPPVDVALVLYAEWVEIGEPCDWGGFHMDPLVICSFCGRTALNEKWTFCPNCGSKMTNEEIETKIQAEIVAFGFWKERGNNRGMECSECGYPIRYKNAIPDTAAFYCRCPKCGAKMKEGDMNAGHRKY